MQSQRTMVATVMEPTSRATLEAAVGVRCHAYHADTLRDAIRVVRERPVEAVLVSPNAVRRDQIGHLARLVDGFPGIPTFAVLSKHDAHSSHQLLALGAIGVRELIDLSERQGWVRLRAIVAQPTGRTAADILTKIIPALGEPAPEVRHFFEVLVRLAPETSTVRQFCRDLGLQPSTFVSRFHRLQLPSPKRYLASLRLVFAAALLEPPGRSVADVAYRLEFSSPQSFGRHLRNLLGVTAGEFRGRFPFPVALDDYVARLIVPFQAVFRTFQPLNLG
jgi:AraC-like DNA-binding protein